MKPIKIWEDHFFAPWIQRRLKEPLGQDWHWQFSEPQGNAIIWQNLPLYFQNFRIIVLRGEDAPLVASHIERFMLDSTGMTWIPCWLPYHQRQTDLASIFQSVLDCSQTVIQTYLSHGSICPIVFFANAESSCLEDLKTLLQHNPIHRLLIIDSHQNLQAHTGELHLNLSPLPPSALNPSLAEFPQWLTSWQKHGPKIEGLTACHIAKIQKLVHSSAEAPDSYTAWLAAFQGQLSPYSKYLKHLRRTHPDEPLFSLTDITQLSYSLSELAQNILTSIQPQDISGLEGPINSGCSTLLDFLELFCFERSEHWFPIRITLTKDHSSIHSTLQSKLNDIKNFIMPKVNTFADLRLSINRNGQTLLFLIDYENSPLIKETLQQLSSWVFSEACCLVAGNDLPIDIHRLYQLGPLNLTEVVLPAVEAELYKSQPSWLPFWQKHQVELQKYFSQSKLLTGELKQILSNIQNNSLKNIAELLAMLHSPEEYNNLMTFREYLDTRQQQIQEWLSKKLPFGINKSKRLTLETTESFDSTEASNPKKRIPFPALAELEQHQIILIGQGGAGKSVTLKLQELDALVKSQKLLDSIDPWQNHYVLWQEVKRQKRRLLKNEWGELQLNNPKLPDLCHDIKKVVYFDGLNELVQEDRHLLLTSIQERKVPFDDQTSFIWSTRPYEVEKYRPNAELANYSYEELPLLPLSKEQISDFLKTHAPKLSEEIRNEIRDHPLSQTPQLLYLLVKLHQEGYLSQAPELSKAQLLGKYIHTRISAVLSPDERQDFWASMYRLYLPEDQKKTSLPTPDTYNLSSSTSSDFHTAPQRLLEKISESNHDKYLLLKQDQDYAWWHPSFEEYIQARVLLIQLLGLDIQTLSKEELCLKNTSSKQILWKKSFCKKVLKNKQYTQAWILAISLLPTHFPEQAMKSATKTLSLRQQLLRLSLQYNSDIPLAFFHTKTYQESEKKQFQNWVNQKCIFWNSILMSNWRRWADKWFEETILKHLNGPEIFQLRAILYIFTFIVIISTGLMINRENELQQQRYNQQREAIINQYNTVIHRMAENNISNNKLQEKIKKVREGFILDSSSPFHPVRPDSIIKFTINIINQIIIIVLLGLIYILYRLHVEKKIKHNLVHLMHLDETSFTQKFWGTSRRLNSNMLRFLELVGSQRQIFREMKESYFKKWNPGEKIPESWLSQDNYIKLDLMKDYIKASNDIWYKKFHTEFKRSYHFHFGTRVKNELKKDRISNLWILAVFFLLLSAFVIYFHSVWLEHRANLLQHEIIKIHEENQMLSAKLAEIRTLAAIEAQAIQLDMQPVDMFHYIIIDPQIYQDIENPSYKDIEASSKPVNTPFSF